MQLSPILSSFKREERYEQGRANEALIFLGMVVTITSGKYQGHHGTITKITAKKVQVRIEKLDKKPYLFKAIIVPLHESTVSRQGQASISKKLVKEKNDKFVLCEDMEVPIPRGIYKGKYGIVRRITRSMVYVEIDGVERCIRKSSLGFLGDKEDDVDTPCSASNIDGVSTILTMDTTTSSNNIIGETCQSILGRNNSKQIHRTTPPSVGCNILIEGGKYRNNSAKILKIFPVMVLVQLNNSKKEVRVRKSNISWSKNGGPAFDLSEIKSNKKVVLHRGTIKQLKNVDQNNEWCISDHGNGGLKIAGRYVTLTRLESKQEKATFLDHFLGNGRRVIKIPLNKDEILSPFPPSFNEYGSTYELVSTKVLADGEIGGSFYKPNALKLVYAQVSGPGLKTISMKEELEKIANFAALDTRKVVSRLELLQSPCHKFSKRGSGERQGIFFLKSEDFTIIKERGHVGCGFICDKFLCDLLGHDKKAREATSIQVRCIIPNMGIFKGELQKKKMQEGDLSSSPSPPIQLPESMLKVGPTIVGNTEDSRAVMVICQGGIDPSENSSYIGRLPTVNRNARSLLSKSSDGGPPTMLKSFKPKEVHSMICRLLSALNVPKDVLTSYNRKCKAKPLDEIGHSFVRGVADPTDSLPPGHVFLTGVQNEDTLGDEIFVTRSPCIKKDDGMLLKVVTKRSQLPSSSSMTDEQFEFLKSMPFGALIFAFPSKGMKSIPESIADGDLDGDRYFVCWKKEILEHIDVEPFVEEATTATPCTLSSSSSSSSSSLSLSRAIKEERAEEDTLMIKKEEGADDKGKDWFQLAQEQMTDTSIIDIGKLIGKLYKLSAEAADKDKERSIGNPDAECFADAYYQALDYAKHGNPIVLPLHLHEKVPEHLRKYLCVSTTAFQLQFKK